MGARKKEMGSIMEPASTMALEKALWLRQPTLKVGSYLRDLALRLFTVPWVALIHESRHGALYGLLSMGYLWSIVSSRILTPQYAA
jgi:hypothetical protein